MEPQARALLKRISKSLFIGLIWLVLNAVFAIKGDNAFIEGHITAGNIFFYSWLLVSVTGLILIYKRMWAGKL